MRADVSDKNELVYNSDGSEVQSIGTITLEGHGVRQIGIMAFLVVVLLYFCI